MESLRSTDGNHPNMKQTFKFTHMLAAALLTLAVVVPQLCQAQIMVVGIDRKFAYDDKAVRQALEPGHDEVMFFNVQNPESPNFIGSLQLENSILGPPTNVAVSPDQSIALIANSVHSEKTETGWKAAPADEVFVVDLKSSPPRLAQTLKVGRQPSGIAISQDGKFALVANRESKSITMLLIDGPTVSVGETTPTEDSVGAVAIAPDGRRAIATKTAVHKVVLLKIGADRKISIEANLWAGLFPWNVAISPDGGRALVNNIGNNGQSDGGAKTVSVIDLSATVPFVSDHVSVGDAPEGIAWSPNGAFAAITILQGSYDAPSTAWFKRDVGSVTLLRTTGAKIGVANSVDVGAFPEGIAFAPDGQHIYVGNFRSNTISILKIDGSGRLIEARPAIKLPGPPASLRIGSQ
jgi:DNA-binding beta-propeller fold protein YncE